MNNPRPDRAAILEALTAMFGPEDVIELRAFPKGRKRTDAGYFDGAHRQELADEAARLNAAGAATYVTLNQIDPQLLGRYSNRIEPFAEATATDANVLRRRWFLIDFDPVRPKATSANAEQLAAAKERARACYQELKSAGWPEPLAGESGNGWHLLYPLDLPNDDQSRDLVKNALVALAQQFDDSVVQVDQQVFNAARITKLFGTVACKGDNTERSPWRLSRLVTKPGRDTLVSTEQLRALQPEKVNGNEYHKSAKFDLENFLSRLGIKYDQDVHEGRERYRLDHCPFNSEHGRGEAAIFRTTDGKLGFKCQHNSCANRTWQDVRAIVEGPRQAKGPKARPGKEPPKHEREPGEDEFEGIRCARELLELPDTPAIYCLPERIPSGLVVFGGRPKSKKSWAALQLSIAKAMGGETLGKCATKQRVLGLFLEDNNHRMRRRLKFFGLTPQSASELLHIEYDWPTGLLGVGKLERWMLAYPDTGLIVIDVLQRFRGAKDPRQSAYEADYETMRMLHAMCAKFSGLTILVLHHVRKGVVEEPIEALNGTFGIAGAADAYVILCRRVADNRWAVHIDGRDWESFEHDFVWEWRDQIGWTWLGLLEESATDQQSEILAMAKAEGYVTPSAVAEHFNITKQAAHDALQVLVKRDVLFNAGRGHYKPVHVTVP
jgi:hypothetical protein